MARDAKGVRDSEGLVHERADAHLADLEERHGHLLAREVTHDALKAYLREDERPRVHRRRPRSASQYMEPTGRQVGYARRLMVDAGMSTKCLRGMSRHEVGLLIAQLST
ncbi:MAG: hypothetical protein ACREMY_09075 [bacterium]